MCPYSTPLRLPFLSGSQENKKASLEIPILSFFLKKEKAKTKRRNSVAEVS